MKLEQKENLKDLAFRLSQQPELAQEASLFQNRRGSEDALTVVY